MYGYEIPVTESAYSARERYLNDKKQEKQLMESKRQYSEFISNSRDYFLTEAINMILQNSDAVPVTLIAKDYGYSGKAFNAMLHEYRIQYYVGGTWCLYQNYADNGYTHCNTHITKRGHTRMHTCWTQKGRLFLYIFLKKQGILPQIERSH